MSESAYETSPEEIMERLMIAVMNGWVTDLSESVINKASWDFAAETIFDLNLWADLRADEALTNRMLVDDLALLAERGRGNLSIDRKEFVELWKKLTPEQRRAFLKELYHNIAMYGLEEFLDTIGKDLDLKDVKDYLNGKISFHDLMYKLAKKYGLLDRDLIYDPEADSFENAVSLTDYISDEELKELVRKRVVLLRKRMPPKVKKFK